MSELIEEMQQFGLNELESKVYFTLLQEQNLTATELSRKTKINRSQMYDILKKLIVSGICIEVLGSVRKYSAVNPKLVIQKFYKQIERTTKAAEKLSPVLMDIYNNNVENSDPLDFIKVLRTNKNIYENVMTAVRSAKEIVRVFIKPPYSMDIDKNEEESKSLKKGVIHKGLYQLESGNNKQFVKRLKHYEKQGEEIRIVPDLPMKMIIIDEKIVIFNMQHSVISGTQYTSMMIENSNLAQLLIKTYDIYWKEGLTLKEFISQNNKIV